MNNHQQIVYRLYNKLTIPTTLIMHTTTNLKNKLSGIYPSFINTLIKLNPNSRRIIDMIRESILS